MYHVNVNVNLMKENVIQNYWWNNNVDVSAKSIMKKRKILYLES